MRRFIVLLSGLLLVGQLAAQNLETLLTDNDLIRWNTDLQLPSAVGVDRPARGLAGVFAGKIGHSLVLAGGTDFPEPGKNVGMRMSIVTLRDNGRCSQRHCRLRLPMG